jgi:GNAT superfamily N-acetyltransferase
VATRFEFHPVTAERWDDMARLFGPRGACAGCWCMWPRVRGGEFARIKGEGARRRMRAIVAGGGTPGILAYAGDEPVGWCAVAPRTDFSRLESSRVMAALDDQPVWSVPCLFVAREWRGRGVPARLLGAAARFAAARGARVLESYPIDTEGKRQADAFLWHGVRSMFVRAGFREVARRSATRPIMRKALRATTSAAAQRKTRTAVSRG